MIITVCGKNHRSGLSSKTGRPYDFTELHFTAIRKNVVGQAAVTSNIDATIIKNDDIIVGADYNIETDIDGEILSMTICEPLKSGDSNG